MHGVTNQSTTIPYLYLFKRGSYGVYIDYHWRGESTVLMESLNYLYFFFFWQLKTDLYNEVPFVIQMDRDISNSRWNCLSLQLEQHLELLSEQSKWYKSTFMVSVFVTRILQHYKNHFMFWNMCKALHVLTWRV